MSPETRHQPVELTPDQDQFGDDMIEIYGLEDIAHRYVELKNDAGEVTQSGTVKEAIIFCEFFHDLDPELPRQIFNKVLGDA